MSFDFDPKDYDAAENIEMDTFDETDPGVLDATEEAQLNVNVPEVPGVPNLSEVLEVLNLPEAPGVFVSPEKIEKINEFYKHLIDNGYPINKDALLAHKALFKINDDKELFIKHKNITTKLTYENEPDKFLLPSTIISNYNRDNPEKGGAKFVRNVLGIGDKPKIPLPVEAQVRVLNQNIHQDEEIENSSPQELVDNAGQVVENLDDIETLYDDVGVQTDDLILQQEFRDLKRAKKFLNSIRGQILVAVDKISNYDEQIKN